MAASELSSARAALRRGHFKEALAALPDAGRRRSGDSQAEGESLRAQLLFLVGRVVEAEDLAALMLSQRDIPSGSLARCHAVLAAVRCGAGKLTEASEHFNKALRLTQEAGNYHEHCEYQLEFLDLLIDLHGPESTASFLREARQNALRCGDAQVLANFHTRLARLEARVGSFSTALRHLAASRRLLADDPNDWLLGAGYLDSSVIKAFQSNLEGAREDAKEAFRISSLSGHAHTRFGSLINLAHAEYLMGRFDEALSIVEIPEQLIRGSMLHFGFLDSRANVLIELGELDQAGGLVSELEFYAQHQTEQSSWAVLTTLHTKGRWLLRKRLWESAAEHLARAIATADLHQDRIWGARLRLQRAEAEIELNHPVEALQLIERAGQLAPDFGNLSLRADFERVRAKLWNVEGLLDAAARSLGRSFRIARGLGDAVLLRAATRTLIGDLSAAMEAGPTMLPHAQVDVSAVVATKNESELLRRQPMTPVDVVDAVENLLALSGSPFLLGHETLELVRGLASARSLAFAASDNRKTVRVLDCYGWDHESARQRAAQSDGPDVIPLGGHHDLSYHLLVEPKDDLASRTAVAAVRRIIAAARQLEAFRRQERERAALWPPEELSTDTDTVFVSPEMLRLVRTAERVGPTTLPVLLTGETGTGKEVIARIIHKASPRADKVFSPFNCTAVPRDMLDSQLFGYRRGAFTGAQESFPGVIRAAAGGTLFLDEIGEVGFDLQPKLLRFLETGEIHPLGEAHPVKVDVRVIAATNANLDRMVADGRFREDLLYRINILHIKLPPLRERREEIPALVEHYLRRWAAEFGKGWPRVTEEAMEYLLLFKWPGNVRQLANELRRVVALLEPDGAITPAHLSPEIRASRRTVPTDERRSDAETVVRLDQPLNTVLESIERLMVSRALERSQGRLEDAARLLGISRKGLFLKRKRWGMQ